MIEDLAEVCVGVDRLRDLREQLGVRRNCDRPLLRRRLDDHFDRPGREQRTRTISHSRPIKAASSAVLG